MTSHRDVEHVPPIDNASSPGEMTSRKSFPLGEGQWRGRRKTVEKLFFCRKTVENTALKLKQHIVFERSI